MGAGSAGVTFFVMAAASMGMNHVIKERSGGWYDGIMDWINSW